MTPVYMHANMPMDMAYYIIIYNLTGQYYYTYMFMLAITSQWGNTEAFYKRHIVSQSLDTFHC